MNEMALTIPVGVARSAICQMPMPAVERVEILGGGVTARWSVHAVSGYENASQTGRYKAWIGHDVALRWGDPSGLEGMSLTAGVLNVTDRGAAATGREPFGPSPRSLSPLPRGDRAAPTRQAAMLSSRLPPPVSMAILRAFSASGSSRTRSMCSSPLSSAAPLTWMWSARLKRRSKARVAIPRCR